MLSATEVTAPTSISSPVAESEADSSKLKWNLAIIILSIVAVFAILTIIFVVFKAKKRPAGYAKDEEIVSSSAGPLQSSMPPPWESNPGLAKMEIPESYMPETTRNIDDIRSASKFRAEHHQLEESEFLMRNEPED